MAFVLKWMTVVLCAIGSIACGPDAGLAPSRPRKEKHSNPANPIVVENRKPGTSAWLIGQPSQHREIEGYASTTSAAPGEQVQFFVSSNQPATFHWAVYRLGYYGGMGARTVVEGGSLAIAPQADCPVDAGTGLIECQWQPTFQIFVDGFFVTGQYLVKLSRDDGYESYVPFVVREPEQRAPILYQSSVNTWQAYNAWGGASLYANQLPKSVGFTDRHAHRVSFDRPYGGTGEGQLMIAERWFLQWMEKEGFDAAYVTNVDVETHPALLEGRQIFLDVGHDEYWSEAERGGVELARNSGTALAFFSANDAYWRVRVDPSSTGTPSRVITCYKDASLDPKKDEHDTTAEWRQSPDPRPEDALVGQMYELFTRVDGFPLVVTRADHWVYEGTLLSNDDAVGHVIGIEYDHAWHDASTPQGLEVLANSDAFGTYGSDVPANMTVYPTNDGFVFSAGSIQWSYGLGKPGYEDTRIERISENVLAGAGVAPVFPTVVERPPPPTDVGDAALVQVVAGTGEPGYVDGPAASAQFDAPAGVAVDLSGNIYVTEARNHRLRKITPDGMVSTLAGGGPSGVTTGPRYSDGKGDHAGFSVPTGIAVALDGTIYVSDSHNNSIRKVTPDGHVSNLAGDGDTGFEDSTVPTDATFAYPRGLAIGPDGALYVADAYNSAIRRIDAKGVTTVAQGKTELSGVAVAPDGTVYALDTEGNGIDVVQNGQLVRIVNLAGTGGDQPGLGATAMLRPADGIVVAGGSLIVADSANYKVRRVSLTPEHTVTTLVGSGRAGLAVGSGAEARVVNPRGIARMGNGFLVADSGNHRILRVIP